MNNIMKRAAILIALAVLAETATYLSARLELVGFDQKVRELTVKDGGL